MATDTENPPAFSPSASFRATMQAVTSGEKDPAKLRETASAAMTERLSRDPIPAAASEGEPEEREPTEEQKPNEGEGTGEGEGAEQLGSGEAQTTEEGEGEGEGTTPDEGDEAERASAERDRLRKEMSGEDGAEPAEKKDTMRGEMPADSDRVRKRIKHYEGLISDRDKVLDSTKKELATVQAQLVQLQKKGAGVPENIQDELNALRMFRRRYAAETDPEFQQRFSTRIDESNDLIDEALQAVNVSEKLRKRIRDMGGMDAFLQADLKIPVAQENGQTKQYDPRQFIGLVLDEAKKVAPDAEAVLRAEMANQRRIGAEKKKFFEAGNKEAEAYFAKLEEGRTRDIEADKELDAKLDEVAGNFKAAAHVQDWMRDVSPPENASEEKQAEIRAENAHRAKMRKLFDLQVDMPLIRKAAKLAKTQQEMDDLGSMILDSARVFHVERELKAARARIKALEKQIDKVRTAGSRTTPGRTTGGRETVDTSGEPKRTDFTSDLQYSIAYQRWEKSKGK